MPAKLPEDASQRLDAAQGDLRERCWYNVQRLHKWSGRLDREGPCGEDADYYEAMGPRSLFLGPIAWDGPADKSRLSHEEITGALRRKLVPLLERYAIDLATAAGEAYWQIGLAASDFESQLETIVEAVQLDTARVAADASKDLGLDLEVGPVLADLGARLQAWSHDCHERYSAHAALHGIETTSEPKRKAGGSSEAAGREAKRSNRTEAEKRSLVLGTAGLPGGRPSGVPFASNPTIQELLKTKPEVAPLVSHVAAIDQARAEAEVEYRERELAEQWGAWSGVHPWDDKPDLEVTECPWWNAGAQYVFRVTAAWRKHSSFPPDRTEAVLPKQLGMVAEWVYWKRVFVHDAVHASSSRAEDLLGDRNVKRFTDFSRLFCQRKFAEADLDEWREHARATARTEGNRVKPNTTAPENGAGQPRHGPISITKIDGTIQFIDPDETKSEKSIWAPEDEERISACVTAGRAAVRTDLEQIFGKKDWPEVADLIPPFRRYAMEVFDAYAKAYTRVEGALDAYDDAMRSRLLPMVLRDLFGREWDRSPGEKVIRVHWQKGRDGKATGTEVEVFAGNDPDPTCVFHELVSSAIDHRYRFYDKRPSPAPGEPPGIQASNLDSWRYIGLNERHNLALAIQPYLQDRMAHWRFVFVPRSSDDSGAGSQPEGAAPDHAPVSANDEPALDSATRIEFERGLALAEVTLAEDLKNEGPSLEIARKYVASATLTLARCILTPDCDNPRERIQRSYNFAEWFAADTMKTLWVWLCVFGEMNSSGKLEKFDRERPADPKGLTDAEMRAWHSCLYEAAHLALDEYVPGFWRERLKYFSEVSAQRASDEAAPPKSTAPDLGADREGVQPPDSAPPRQESAGPTGRGGKKSRKADGTLLDGKRLVSFGTAEQYLGISERQRQKLMNTGVLKVEGGGQNRKITVDSLKAYLPPENPN